MLLAHCHQSPAPWHFPRGVRLGSRRVPHVAVLLGRPPQSPRHRLPQSSRLAGPRSPTRAPGGASTRQYGDLHRCECAHVNMDQVKDIRLATDARQQHGPSKASGDYPWRWLLDYKGPSVLSCIPSLLSALSKALKSSPLTPCLARRPGVPVAPCAGGLASTRSLEGKGKDVIADRGASLPEAAVAMAGVGG